jgi:hypothetical protein
MLTDSLGRDSAGSAIAWTAMGRMGTDCTRLRIRMLGVRILRARSRGLRPTLDIRRVNAYFGELQETVILAVG